MMLGTPKKAMRWEKKGLIFVAHGQHEWMAHHAYVPVADKISDEVVRIYFGVRDNQNQTVPTFLDVEAGNPSNVLYVHDQPSLGLGALGTFDENGVTPSCVVNHAGKKYLFYVGWNKGVSVPYRNALGLAISDDGGVSFRRLCPGPVVDRGPWDPYFIAANFVLIEDEVWRMWYVSITGFQVVHGKPEPQYLIKYAESKDGIFWDRKNITCLANQYDDEALTRPAIIKENGLYRMWYCYRGSVDFRTDRKQSYRIGYAESPDGLSWLRKDEEVGIEPSESGWDSEMIEYPFVYEHKGRKYMLYNGNGFGESGLGYAVLDEG